jgi:N-acetylglucosaminyldiphosphoundecaprenol N-acetyl-beta-D-mannosaminyltransferase
MKKVNVCGVGISAINLDLAGRIFEEWIAQKKKTYVCVAPVSTVVDCQFDKTYHDIVTKADMVTPDGMPVVWTARLKGERQVKRTYGPDLMLTIFGEGQTKGYRHFFYGANPEVCRKLRTVLLQKFPKAQIVGMHSPDKVTLDFKEDDHIIKKINEARPDIVWVGLGSPKQDYWMVHHRGCLQASVLVGVGAAFDFLSGEKKQAPKWMQRSGLEWLFRLGSEPKRLWKRYLVGNTMFVYFWLRDLVKRSP